MRSLEHRLKRPSMPLHSGMLRKSTTPNSVQSPDPNPGVDTEIIAALVAPFISKDPKGLQASIMHRGHPGPPPPRSFGRRVARYPAIRLGPWHMEWGLTRQNLQNLEPYIHSPKFQNKHLFADVG